MVTPAIPHHAVDLVPLRTAIRTALLANATISALTTTISSVGDVTDNVPLYINIAMIGYVPKNTYDRTEGEATAQITCVGVGYPGDLRALRAAAATVMLDTAWAVTGYDVLDVTLKIGLPDMTPLVQSKIVYQEADRYCILMRKQAI